MATIIFFIRLNLAFHTAIRGKVNCFLGKSGQMLAGFRTCFFDFLYTTVQRNFSIGSVIHDFYLLQYYLQKYKIKSRKNSIRVKH